MPQPEELAGAQWIARPVPASTRIVRQITATRIDWAESGRALGQSFHAPGPIVAVNVDLVGPGEGTEPYTTEVDFTLSLESSTGEVVVERRFQGRQLVWDYFGPLLDVTPPAPAGDYRVTLRVDRGTVGWKTADAGDETPDDGISPLPVAGVATLEGEVVPGVRTIGVDTLPAPNPVFRRSFALAERPVEASLSATVLGTGVVHVNGVRVGDEALEPAVTDYDKSILFRTWDVAHLLRAGANEIRIDAGRERYSARGGDVWGWNLAPWHREPVALLRLDVTDAAGRAVRILTDESWTTAPGEVQAERLFRGEDWVLGGEPVDSESASVVAAPRGALRRAELPPVRALAPLPAITSVPLDDRRTVLDFGRVLVGRIRFRVTGAAGGSVRVVTGEQLASDGSVICDNMLVAGEAQLDTITLGGPVVDAVWEPQFGYRGYRWAQIETSGGVRVEEIRTIPLYTEVDRVGSLSSEEPVLEWIDAATARTFLNNLHGIPTDTPIYEKNGWTADAHLATEGLLHHFDLRAAFGKWVQDHIDAQAPDGSIPQIIPSPGWGKASDPVWSSSAVLIPWYLFREYGDREELRRAAPMITRFADDVLSKLDGGIWRGRTWGDWLSPSYMTGPEGMAPIATAMSVTIMQHTAAVLRALEDDAAATRYDDAARVIADAYHAAYFDSDAGIYSVAGVGYRQVLNILPLAFGIAPAASVASVRRGLIADLEDRTDGHLDCGAIGVRHLLGVLSDAGRDDLALTVLTRRTRPGWGAWYEAGETTLLESWDVDARSRNHYFLGSVSAWIQQRVGALRATEPGWTSFEVAPVDDDRVTHGAARHRTPLGDAIVSWERGAEAFRIEIDVPAGVTALVRTTSEESEVAGGHHVLHLAR